MQGKAAPVSLDEPIGRLSRMDAMQAQQMAQAQRRRDQSRLQIVKAALARIRGGTYGECLRCGETVSYERLRLAPESPLCLSCRAETEA